METRSRISAEFNESLRNVSPEQAVTTHLSKMWKDKELPNIEHPETFGEPVNNFYSGSNDYIIKHPGGYIIIGEESAVSYGEFDGFSAGVKSLKQISDGLERTKDYTIYKIKDQTVVDKSDILIPSSLPIDKIDIPNRAVISSGMSFKMDEIDLDRQSNTFIVNELFFNGVTYTTKHGTVTKGVVPRKVVEVNESNSGISGSDTEGLSDDIDRE